MNAIAALDTAGRPRSPATLPGYHTGRAPRNKRREVGMDAWGIRSVVATCLAGGLSNATVVELDGGHAGLVEYPDDFLAALMGSNVSGDTGR